MRNNHTLQKDRLNFRIVRETYKVQVNEYLFITDHKLRVISV